MTTRKYPKNFGFGIGMSVFVTCVIWAPQAFSKSCTYQIKEDTAKLTWTGYKFTEKKAVSGTFEKIVWNQNKKSTSLKGLIESISWEIDTASVASGDKARDFTLTSKFFGLMKSAPKIGGDVKSFNADKKSSVATISINDVNTDITFKVVTDKNNLKWNGTLKLSEQFQMVASINSLAEACKVLHTGTDGKAVTWDEVGLEVSATYLETCT